MPEEGEFELKPIFDSSETEEELEKRKNSGVTTFSEGLTLLGEIVKFGCEPGDQDVIKAGLRLIKDISLPVTRETIISHGGYGRATRFDVESLKYAGGGFPGCGGYVEVLNIKNPPDNRCGYIVNEFDSTDRGGRFHEFPSVEDMLEAWEKGFNFISESEKILRSVKYGHLTPWFYAIANQALNGDIAYPNWVRDDPIFRPGKKFLVKGYSDDWELKTCMGLSSRIKKGQDGKDWEYLVIYWSDGTLFKEEALVVADYSSGLAGWKHAGFTNLKERIKPINEENIWVQQSIELFQKCLIGKIDSMEIFTSDGRLITVNSETIHKANRRFPKNTFQKDIEGGKEARAIIKSGEDVVILGDDRMLIEKSDDQT